MMWSISSLFNTGAFQPGVILFIHFHRLALQNSEHETGVSYDKSRRSELHYESVNFLFVRLMFQSHFREVFKHFLTACVHSHTGWAYNKELTQNPERTETWRWWTGIALLKDLDSFNDAHFTGVSHPHQCQKKCDERWAINHASL
jgi:hypothetical protein